MSIYILKPTFCFTVGFESCAHPDVYCMKITYFSPEGKYETYSCDKHDNHRQCDPSSVRGAIRFCDNVSNIHDYGWWIFQSV